MRKGIYAHTRNPMYVGNALIAIGVTLVTSSPMTYAIVIPFFLYVYWSLISAEEAYLLKRFGDEYRAYCDAVPRFFPSFRGLRSTLALPYDWKRAVRKELSTIAGLLLGLIALSLGRTYFLHGWTAAQAAAPQALMVMAGILILYGFLVALKRARHFFY